ncbi:hypothetical protein AB4K20DRAFT_1880044 [Rhizopus microsporus]
MGDPSFIQSVILECLLVFYGLTFLEYFGRYDTSIFSVTNYTLMLIYLAPCVTMTFTWR